MDSKCDITNVIEYGIYDCIGLRDLLNKLGYMIDIRA